MKASRILCLFMFIFFCFTHVLFALEPSEYTLSYSLIPDTENADALQLDIIVELPANVHITSEFLDSDLLMPDGFSIRNRSYHESIFYNGSLIYRDKVSFRFIIESDEINRRKNGPDRHFQGRIKYQTCNELPFEQCMPPVDRFFELDMNLGNDEGSARIAQFKEISKLDESEQEPGYQNRQDAIRETGGIIENRLKKALSESILLALFFIFIAGILTSFTPCVYPMIPITIALFSGDMGKKRSSSFLKAVVYVLGLSLTYAVLGLISGLTGALFGSIAQHPVFIILIISILFLMALSMFGFFDLQLPASIQDRLSSSRKGGFGGVFILGMVFGLIAAPCAGPVVITILTYIASTQNPLLGFLFLFIYALGLGLLFILIGTFSGVLSSLPKAGGWMVLVKHFFGYAILMLLVYFAAPLLDSQAVLFAYGFIIILMGIFFIREVLSHLKDDTLKNIIIAVGILLVAYGSLKLYESYAPAGGFLQDSRMSSEMHWIYDLDEGMARSEREGKPAIIHFTADWCAYCKKMERTTFRERDVIEYLENYIMIKVDLTAIDSDNEKIMQEYSIKGLPMIIVYSPSNRELLRIDRYIDGDQLIKLLRSI